ncbi:mannosyl-oligosaccharide glucosidase GCS1-like isoform X2 [Tasmannia lanceolata]|uniref:mannosyl-oligosaccharide glucosidase GCS1-like isoform X2 n=1 Tax=Tasmannia lanceolata TaxID=3420 RepID=UPI00406280D6
MTGSSRRAARSRIKPSNDVDSGDSVQNLKAIPPRIRKERGNDHASSLRLMNVNLKSLLGFGILAFLIIVFIIYYHFDTVEEVQKLRVITPLPAPKMMDLPQFQGDHKESLYWGTYRSLVYLGIRARTPRSLIAGLMWIGVKDGQYFMRHVCQDSDGLSKYGWTHHNGRDYGHQVLVDQELTLTTSFLKAKMNGSGYGGDWAVQVGVQNDKSRLDDDLWRTAHLFFYLADEEGYAISIDRELLSFHGSTLLAFGSHDDVGGWELHLDSSDNLEVHYSGFRSRHMHNLTELFQETLGVHARRIGRLQLPDTSEHSPNIVVFQVSGKNPFKIDIAFVSGTDSKNPRVEERIKSLTGAQLTNRLNEKQNDFEDKYRRCFNLTDKVDSESMIVGRAAIGNLLGGIGYFYGSSKIALPKDSNLENGNSFVPYWPAALYTAVPSRSFFPRGFLWDEGFHQLLIWRWDIGICLDIIGHWLDLMNIDGWIPREQILGAEALSKVPEEFVLQHPTNGNPPTLFLVLRVRFFQICLVEQKEASFLSLKTTRFLHSWIGPSFASMPGSNGSIVHNQTLSSGLDDYPRASHPNEDELHLDLRCWMFLAADCMHSIAELLGMRNSSEMGYYSMAKQLSNFEILNQMHLDDTYGAYFDFGNHTEKVRLRWHEVKGSSSNYAGRELLREVLERPQLGLVPHVGYVSLFPFMMKMIPSESLILGKQLDLVFNRSTLWTDYGLRSLSKTSSVYMKRNTEHDPPYWRGPIWMNMNYMILSALHHYSEADGPHKAKARMIYEELRKNLIGNVVRNYFQTGYLWEQYEEKNKGRGKGARPFTGWTSLVLLMMAESY